MESNIPVKKLHVLLAPFPAFGHIIPILELAKKLSKFHDVTFAVSSLKVPELTTRGLIGAGDAVNVLGIVDGVVDDFDNPTDPGAVPRVFKAVIPAIAELLTEMPTEHHPVGTSEITKPVDIVIVDIFIGGAAAVCHERGVPYYLFQTGTTFMIRLILTISDDSPTVAEMEDAPFMQLLEPGAPPPPLPEMMKKLFMPIRKTMHLSSGGIVNSFLDIEMDAVREVKKDPSMKGLTMHCVGPLLPEDKGAITSSHLATEKKIMDWLNQQKPNSVVYISFGSMATPTPAQLQEIGLALLSLGHPFIWSIRDKNHEFLPEEIAGKIGDQFNVAGSKFLVIPWAPQKQILTHSSVGAFISHCGWNSTLEGLSGKKPIVAWPMAADQYINAQWIVKIGAAVLIPGTGMLGKRTVEAQEIETALRNVAGWNCENDERSKYADAAEKWGDKVNSSWTPPNGCSYVEFMDLIHFHQMK